MKKIFSISILIVISFNFLSCTKKDKAITPKASLERLINGNKRFSNNKVKKINNTKKRKELLNTQKPFAAILGCSDSRVTPEIIFDEGLGELFVVRVAGNIVNEPILESLEYSAKYLNSSIILVLSHENCGAVDATINNQIEDIEAIANIIEPSVIQAKKFKSDNLLAKASKLNALNMKKEIEQSTIIKKLIDDNKIQVYAAYYNFKTGLVEILDDQS
jgi:carbonic anhydrase